MTTDYDIRADDRAADRVLSLLVSSWMGGPFKWVHVGRELGTKDTNAVGQIIAKLRRVGHLIEGDRVKGYRYLGCTAPSRFIRLPAPLPKPGTTTRHHDLPQARNSATGEERSGLHAPQSPES